MNVINQFVHFFFIVKLYHIPLNFLIVSWSMVSSDIQIEGLSRGINKFGVDLYQVLIVSFLRFRRTFN